MSNYYTGVTILAVFSMVLMVMFTNANPVFTSRKKRQFTISFYVTIIGAVAEWGAKFLEANTSIIWLHTVVKTIDLIVAPTIPMFIIPAITDTEKYIKTMFWLVLGNAVLEILSCFTGLIFFVDASNVYHHGPLYGIYIFVYMAEAFMLIYATIEAIKKYQATNTNIHTFLMVFLATGIIMQNLDSSIRVDYITICIVLILFYIEYVEILQSIDSLTSLLNRYIYDTKISRMNEKATIINVDIDYFKQINDQYGHLYGDKCLKIISHVLKSVFEGYGSCYRIGGDEFCVILTNSHEKVNEILSALHERMGECRKDEPILPFISTGYAFFDPEKDNIIRTIEKADVMMYKFKNTRKKLFEEGKNLCYIEILNEIKDEI